jgi:Glyoxalase-like domain
LATFAETTKRATTSFYSARLTGFGPHLSLDQVRSSLQIPPRLHLDLYTDDQAHEVERLIALGATEVHWDKRPPDADYVILADPEGNRFCVVDTAR